MDDSEETKNDYDHQSNTTDKLETVSNFSMENRQNDLNGENNHLESKGRFNLRKGVSVYIGDEDFDLDDEDDVYSHSEAITARSLKLNISRKGHRRQRAYSNEAIKSAVKLVFSKKMSILEASKHFNIPRTSLHNFVSVYKKSRKHGIKNITSSLTNDEEKEIVDLVLKLSRCGKRYSHNELRFLVQLYLINNDRPVFKSGTLPTMGWIAGLVERNPELVLAKSKKNTKVATEDVEEWYDNISKFLTNEWNMDLREMFSSENSSRIFCFNAFKMNINGPSENMENKSAIKKEPALEEGKLDQEVSIILGMSACGIFFSPVVVFLEDSKEVCAQQDSSVLRVMFNSTGRIDSEVALAVVEDFHNEVLRKRIPKPVIFFVNDKQDFAHFSVIEYCWENEICIICLPPRTTKTMTPFEVTIWPKLRSTYCSLWKNSPKNADNKVSVSQFPYLFIDTWEQVKNRKYVSRSFAKSGLMPFDIKSLFGENQNDQLEPPAQTATSDHESPHQEMPKSEERSRGEIEGIQMCLQAIESFIPSDILPVWSRRDPNFKGRCELSFKLWRSVSLLLKAGCAMASIQQMADGFDPFETNNATPSKSQLDPPDHKHENKPAPKKRKLNKSIYSISEESNLNSKKAKLNDSVPLVKLHQNAFLMQGSNNLG